MVSDEQRALWAAIRANPDEDTPRLVYADWLQENGEEDRAEFIRVQCALALIVPTSYPEAEQRQLLEAKEQRLLARHREKWLAPFQTLFRSAEKWHPTDRNRWFTRFGFRRGFVYTDQLEREPLILLTESDDTLEPIVIKVFGISLVEYQRTVVHAVCRWCGAGTFTAFTVGGGTDADIAAIIDGKRLCRLRLLGLWLGSVSDAGVAALSAWPLATSLRSLSLRANPITDAGATALAASPNLTNLARLDLSQTQIGLKGLKQLRERFGKKVVLNP
jgi:uncharacterized protein (TIGR02996 family)